MRLYTLLHYAGACSNYVGFAHTVLFKGVNHAGLAQACVISIDGNLEIVRKESGS